MNNKYLEAANRTYERLLLPLAEYSIYWQLGHSLDTLLDYWFIVHPSGSSNGPVPRETSGIILNKYLSRQSVPWREDDLGKDPWWYDDYCWWGIAALKASQRPHFFECLHAALFSGIADLSWQPVYRHAPNVWKNADQDAFKRYAPLYDGGVWNWIYAENEIAGVPFTPSVPGQEDQLRGIQNTVTNALYWVLMARLYNARRRPEFRRRAELEYSFFKHWFYDPNSEKSLLYYYDSSDREKALVRERVSVYKEYEGKSMSVPGYKPELVWTGDQGLILGALVAHMELVGQKDAAAKEEYQALLGLAKKITCGVMDHLQGEEGNLQPWSPYLHPDDHTSDHGAPGADYDDYSTGIGVYMRYLLDAFTHNADIRDHLLSIDYPTFILKNADYVIEHQEKARPQGRPLLNYVNDLASLLVAYRMTS